MNTWLRVGFLYWAFLSIATTNANDERKPLIWASAGGGWRAMTTAMGYANLFAKAGLFSSNSSAIDSISSNSGGSWFSTQFFFSKPFFERTIAANADELYAFIIQWMDAYGDVDVVLDSIRSKDQDNADLSGIDFFRQLEISAAQLYTSMFKFATADFDSEWSSRPFLPENRVSALRDVALFLQSGIAPVSRRPQSESHLGPADAEQHVYRVILPLQLALENEGLSYKIGVRNSSLPLKVYSGREATNNFRFEDWEKYTLYGGEQTTGPISSVEDNVVSTGLPIAEPFGGQTTAVQAALAGSIFTTQQDGSSPSLFAQLYSLTQYRIQNSESGLQKLQDGLILIATTFALYVLPSFPAKLGLCSQWPRDCGIADFEFADGGFVDGTSLGMHLARYSNTVSEIKAIVTLNNFKTDSDVRFLSYFSTPFNEGVAPGEFLWAPPTVEGNVAQPYPVQSIQIFEDYWDAATFQEELTVLSDVNVSYATRTCTTVQNPALGVHGGTSVHLLIFKLHESTIPTLVLGPFAVDEWKSPLAENARSIAKSREMLQIIQNFVDT